MAAPGEGFTFRDSISHDRVQLVKTAIEEQNLDALQVDTPLRIGNEQLPDFTLERLTGASADIALKYRTKIMGVDFPAVAASLLASLAVARANRYYKDLFTDLTIAVAAAYTVSRDVQVDYNRIGEHSAFKEFEINGRTRDADPNVASRNAWIVSSAMNATALRLAGHLIVESAPPAGFLASIKNQKGTAFSPKDGGKELEKITRELAATLSQSDHDALESFRNEFRRAILVLDTMFGAAGASTEAAEAAAAHLAGAVI